MERCYFPHPVIQPIYGKVTVAMNKKQYLELCKDEKIEPEWAFSDSAVVLFKEGGEREVLYD